VGGFVLGALALAVAAILLFGKSHFFQKSSRAVVFFNDSVAGLTVGAPVTFHGVQVGTVQGISIQFWAETLQARIPVFLELAPDAIIWEGGKMAEGITDYRRLVQAGLRAQLAQQSLVTGQLRVDLDFRPGTAAQLVGAVADLPEIPAVPSQLTQLQNQLAQVPVLMESVQRALVSIERLSNHMDGELAPLAQSARQTADAATQTLQAANAAIHQTQAQASTTLRELNELLPAARAQIDARGDELGRALTDADNTVRSARALLESLNALAQPSSPLRSDLEAAARDLAATTSSLREVAGTVERNPSVLLRGRRNR
jgi:paraquat-inducible protein B